MRLPFSFFYSVNKDTDYETCPTRPFHHPGSCKGLQGVQQHGLPEQRYPPGEDARRGFFAPS